MVRLIAQHSRILSAVTRVELAKRYSGSVLGKAWLVLYPLILLSVYLFVYLVVFKVQFEGGGPLGYAIFVFSGLIPYIGFMEAVSTGHARRHDVPATYLPSAITGNTSLYR